VIALSEADTSEALRPAEADQRNWDFVQRHGLWLVGLSAVAANLVGSVFNIWYNSSQIEPLLTEVQHNRFHICWQVFNVVVYPVSVACWIAPLWSLAPIHRALLSGEPVEAKVLEAAQRRVVNLPWWILTVATTAWLICVPVFPTALALGDEGVDRVVVWHLITSFWTGGLIAVTHSFFAVELTSQRCLFPVFFRRENPALIPGVWPLSIVARGILWALSAVVSPVVSLVLMLIVPRAINAAPWLGVAVGAVSIGFGLTTAWFLAKLIAVPVHALRDAAGRVAEGDLSVRVNLLRADDFGPLIESFNHMVDGLRERERLQETFGRHVGQEAALQILAAQDGLGGAEREITVMFIDVRNFTDHSATHSPEEVISALNVFFEDAVEIIEKHGGMVNKFLGDGLMALFGAGADRRDHAARAVAAGRELRCCLKTSQQALADAGWPELAIGIGVNTGTAVVGSIGSPRRQEYTAIGDTVNVASRVEALTKQVGHGFLITQATREQLPEDRSFRRLPPQRVKGKTELIHVFAVDE
jgi:adenylate cyclase